MTFIINVHPTFISLYGRGSVPREDEGLAGVTKAVKLT